MIASLFLVALISDIVQKGLPAFTAHRLMLEVPLKAEVIDPEGKRDRSTLLAADYMALVRAALESAVPGVEGRAAKKQLKDLLSSGAADDLRDRVVGNPNLIGSAATVPVLLSDTADLYFKGEGTAIVERPAARGIATPGGTAGQITILSSSNDFSEQLVEAKRALLARAAAIRAEAQRIGKMKYEGALDRMAELEKSALELEQRGTAPALEEVLDSRIPSMLVALNGGLVKITKFSNASATGEVLVPLLSAGEAKPGSWRLLTYTTPESNRNVSDQSIAYLEKLKSAGKVDRAFNWRFFTAGDSREPELAGIRGAVVGSVLTLLVTMVTCLPVGVLAAIYLEKFAPKNRFTDLIEININNLAAVPSIVFGLLGLCGIFELLRDAQVCATCWRIGLGTARCSHNHHSHAGRAQGRATIYRGSCARGRRFEAASDFPSRSSARHAGYHDRHDHRYGTCSGRNRSPAHDWDGRIYCGRSKKSNGECHGPAGANLLVVGFARTRIPSEDRSRHHGTISRSVRDERHGHLAQKKIRETLVMLNTEVAMDMSLVPEMKMLNGQSSARVPKVVARGVDVYYGEKHALKNVNVDIPERSVMSFIGPSGCGKSTFLRCINRMNDTVASCRVTGKITIDGADVYDPEVDPVELRSRVGMVFQKPNPFPKSIYENVAYGPRIHAKAANKAELDEIVERSLKRASLWLEVKDRLTDSGTSLSGGQQQRLCIARAIAVDPNIILMDEPCSALDPIATARIEELMEELRESYTIVIVTHSMQQAARVSQRTAFFHMGSLVEQGETTQIFTNPVDQRTQDYITGRFG